MQLLSSMYHLEVCLLSSHCFFRRLLLFYVLEEDAIPKIQYIPTLC